METTMQRITTAGVLFESGRYFVARRKSGGQIGGLWEFPGGKHRWGETPEQSLAREFMEEFNLPVTVGSCFLLHDFVHKQTLFHLRAFWVEPVGPVRYELNEHEEARWVTMEELLELPLVPSDMAVRDKLEELSLA
ncbi:MAG: NUDIX domain-containing protein [Sphaerochaetaceae bacterium]|jgi:mutator protein MutT|nr:NUDIX domain-containing protein [Sphaerochaetaceae bacterium]MDD3941240.1 NUDIX domain-containing protein [Sphaerochaetaceae bacterium]MDX9938532.1 NUDIX domain-containing protein [Sphaerochaetaceae bacterium]